MARDALLAKPDEAVQARLREQLTPLLESEIDLARRLYDLSVADSRLGYEASNHYFYVPLDLVEKVVNCAYLRTRLTLRAADQDASR